MNSNDLDQINIDDIDIDGIGNDGIDNDDIGNDNIEVHVNNPFDFLNTINFDEMDFSEWYDNSDKSNIKYFEKLPNYIKHGTLIRKDMTINQKPILYKTQSIKMLSHGFPHSSSPLRNYILIGLDRNQDSCVIFNELLERADNFFDSHDTKNKLFGNYASHFKYNRIIRKDTESYPNRPNFCKIKFVVDENGNNQVILNGIPSKADETIMSWNSKVVYTIKFNGIFVLSGRFESENVYGVELLMEKIDVTVANKFNIANYLDEFMFTNSNSGDDDEYDDDEDDEGAKK